MMNDQIKTILEKNNISMLNEVWVVTKSDLQNAIIEICEEQKNQCADTYLNDYSTLPVVVKIRNAKNISETKTNLSTESKNKVTL